MKGVFCKAAKRLSYIEDARCLKVKKTSPYVLTADDFRLQGMQVAALQYEFLTLILATKVRSG